MSAPTPPSPVLRTRLRDILGLALSAGLTNAVALLSLPLLQKFCYGPEAFADMAAYSQVAGILGAIATFRMDLALVKQPDLSSARATADQGLRFLFAMTALAALLPWILEWCAFNAGQIPMLWLWLPLGVMALGANGLLSGWLSREEQFGNLAGIRASGGISGEMLRFLAVPIGNAGLILGRIGGQWISALRGGRLVWNSWRETGPSSPEQRRKVWKENRDYARFITPANMLAMAANGLFILFLFEVCPAGFVGKVGAGMAYLTVGAGLVIRSVNDVFFKHLDDIAPEQLRRQYCLWALALLIIATAGIALLWVMPEEWVVQWLGASWSGLLHIMRVISPWMAPWIAASSLSVIFPHLGLQSWSLKLDVLHLILIVTLIAVTHSNIGPALMTDEEALAFIRQYAGWQFGFYALALAVGVVATGRGKRN